MNMALFQDTIVTFKYPDHLKRMRIQGDQNGEFHQYCFVPGGKPDGTVSLFIWIDPPPGILESAMRDAVNPRCFDYPPIEMKIIAKGKSNLREGALASVVKSRNLRTGMVDFRFICLFSLSGRMIFIQVDRIGDFLEERQLWEEVIRSIELVKGQCINHDSLYTEDVCAPVTSEYTTPFYNAVGPQGCLLEFSRCFKLFVDHHQFYLWDIEKEPYPPLDYTEESMCIGLHTAPYVVAVNPPRELEIPVEVEIRTEYPVVALDDWDHVVEASLELPSGKLELCECSGGPVARFAVPPGTYRVRAMFGNLDTISENELEGQDHYKVALWSAPYEDVRVLKRWKKQ